MPSAARPTARARRLGRRCALALVALGVALLGAELLLALASGWLFPPLYQLDERLGWVHTPGLDRAFTDETGRAVRFATDARGLRGTPWPAARTPGRGRLLVVGDSFTEAAQVEAAESFVGRLGAALDPHEVWNLGVGGYSTVQQLLALEAQLPALAPDAVLLVVYDNDFADNLLPYFAGLGPRPHAVADGDSVRIAPTVPAAFAPFLMPAPGAFWLYGHSALYRTLHKNWWLPRHGAALGAREQIERAGQSPALQQRVMAALLARVAAAVTRAGAKFAVAALPRREDAARGLAPGHAELAAGAAVAGFPFVSLLPAVAGERAAGAYFAVDIHLTASGHEWVAAALQPVARELLRR